MKDFIVDGREQTTSYQEVKNFEEAFKAYTILKALNKNTFEDYWEDFFKQVEEKDNSLTKEVLNSLDDAQKNL